MDWATPDWNRERLTRFWEPGRRLLRCIREYQAARSSCGPLARFRRRACVLRHRYWSVVTGADIPLNARIEGGLLLPHPNGVVVHPAAHIGPNCLLLQQVTLAGEVRLGCHVDVGAGAKILGPVTIGDHARIGANAVVTQDVAPGVTVIGIPARPLVADGLPYEAPDESTPLGP